MDRLSELPESLIHLIFSFLPIRDVVSTTLLSKRWVNLWTTVPYLNICEIIREDDWLTHGVDWLRKFVSRVLALWKGNKILKLKINIGYYPGLYSDIDMWMLFAVNNKVEDLELVTVYRYSHSISVYCTPPCLNLCSSIRKLSLVGCEVQMAPSWNQLKSLKIDTFYYGYMLSYISGEMINWILLGSPNLEEFEVHLQGLLDVINISSRSLKKLKIAYYIRGYKQFTRDVSTLKICCPSLEKLEILGLFVNCLFIDVSSLVDATLPFYNDYNNYNYHKYYGGLPRLYELLGGTLEHIFSTIRHVEKLELSDLCIQALGARKKYLLSPLLNVKFLKLDVHQIELIDMVDLLGIFPNLKMLVIKHHASIELPILEECMEFETSLSKSFPLQLKIVEIAVNLSDFSIFGFIEFLLKHAILLEKLLLRPRGITSCEQRNMFSEKLLNLTKFYPIVKVMLKNN